MFLMYSIAPQKHRFEKNFLEPLFLIEKSCHLSFERENDDISARKRLALPCINSCNEPARRDVHSRAGLGDIDAKHPVSLPQAAALMGLLPLRLAIRSALTKTTTRLMVRLKTINDDIVIQG
ncbi:MAG TPA: hypothetical protein VJ698_16410 [Noviherbaspirillum sp.]|uniref:hypothetical protein n=1 Tax=Noviherbaspirillum sp. TaxID=1926288 RepID=UPI002B49E5BA|nr:hypothetical protein [Noviherbaspirillum sp.]HJV87048.1 hypothetical protein [Noviherbaspirillum sp.]